MKILSIKTLDNIKCLVFNDKNYLKLSVYRIDYINGICYYHILEKIYKDVAIASEKYHFNAYNKLRYLK